MNQPNSIQAHPGGAMSFTGSDGVAVYRATVVANALRLYAKTGLKANRAYTPANMMRVAAEITGNTYKAREYVRAAEDLTTWARSKAQTIQAQA